MTRAESPGSAAHARQQRSQSPCAQLASRGGTDRPRGERSLRSSLLLLLQPTAPARRARYPAASSSRPTSRLVVVCSCGEKSDQGERSHTNVRRARSAHARRGGRHFYFGHGATGQRARPPRGRHTPERRWPAPEYWLQPHARNPCPQHPHDCNTSKKVHRWLQPASQPPSVAGTPASPSAAAEMAEPTRPTDHCLQLAEPCDCCGCGGCPASAVWRDTAFERESPLRRSPSQSEPTTEPFRANLSHSEPL